MSSESEVDDFFDAMDVSPGGKAQALKGSKPAMASQASSDSIDDTSESTSGSKSTEAPVAAAAVSTPAEAAAELEARRSKLRRLRKCVTGDEEVAEPPSPHGSQTDSVEGMAARSSHPFRKVEQDAQSMVSQMSLGKVGRIMAGLDDIDGPAGRPPSAAPSTTPSGGESALAPAPAPVDMTPPTPRTAAELMPPPPAPPPPAPQAAPAVESPPVAAEPPTEPAPPSPPPPALPVPDIVSSVKLSVPRPASPPPPPPPVSAATPAAAPLVAAPGAAAAPPVAPPRRRKRRPPQDAARDSASSLGSGPPEDPAPTEPRQPPAERPGRLRASPTPERRGPDPRRPLTTTGSLRERRRGLSERRAQLTPDRDQEFSLDIRSATKGQYVVKPQDEESARAPVVTVMDRLDVISVQSDASSITDSIASSSYPGLNMQRLDEVKEAQEFLRSHEIQTNIFVKTKTDSGRPLTDKEILDQVSVLNLDTGERIPLSVAEEKLPACINPLSLQIMRMTSEYIRESEDSESDGYPPWPPPPRRRRRRTGDRCVCNISLNMFVCTCGDGRWLGGAPLPVDGFSPPSPADT